MTKAKVNKNNPAVTRDCEIFELNAKDRFIVIELLSREVYDAVVNWTEGGSVVIDETGMGYNIPNLVPVQKMPENLRIKYTYTSP